MFGGIVTFWLLLGTVFAPALAADTVVWRAGDSLQAFAQAQLAAGEALAHPPLLGEFGPGRGNIIILATSELGALSGQVLVPTRDPHHYNRYALPPPPESEFHTMVAAVLFENVDADPAHELLVLCSLMTGIGRDGAKPWYETFVWDWDGSRFQPREDIRRWLHGLQTAQQVRQRLRRR